MFKLFRYFKPHQWVLAVVLLALLGAAAYCDVTLPTYTSELITKMQEGANTASILSTGYTMLMYAGISIGLTLIITFISFYLSTIHAKTLRDKIYEKVESFSLEETSRFSTASLITRTTNDVQQVSSATMMILRVGLSAPITAILALVKINSASYEFTAAMAIAISFLIAGILTIMFFVVPKFKAIQKLIDRLNGVTRENLSGIRVIRAFNAEAEQTKKFEEINDSFTKTNIFTNRIMGLMQPLIMLINYALTITIYWLGCYLILRDNNPSLFPSMFSFTQLSGQVVMSFMMIVMILLMLPRAQVSAGRINEVLSTEPFIKDPITPKNLPQGGKVEFRNVSFKYPSSSKNVIEDISFTANTGETIAFIGATGSGKSTIVNLLPRFFDVTNGDILVNDVSIKDVTQSQLRSTIGYVPQKSVLFAGSVKDNIALASDEFDFSEIETAAKVALVSDFAETLPDGYDTLVSQDGKNLSGGQKQRISIARAVFSNPKIYIFDDSFSALDFKTDAIVRENLSKHASKVTKLIVAQRIGTIKNADKIFVLKDGRIIGRGTHKELLQSCEEYQFIAKSQLSEKELAL